MYHILLFIHDVSNRPTFLASHFVASALLHFLRTGIAQMPAFREGVKRFERFQPPEKCELRQKIDDFRHTNYARRRHC